MKSIWAIMTGFLVMMIVSFVMVLFTMTHPPAPDKRVASRPPIKTSCDCTDHCRKRGVN